MLDQGADIKVVDLSGNTPSHSAVYSISAEMVNILLNNGANSNAKNNNGWTPFVSYIERIKLNNYPFNKDILRLIRDPAKELIELRIQILNCIGITEYLRA